MSKRLTYLLTGLVVVSTALPAQVKAQTLWPSSQKVAHKLRADKTADIKKSTKQLLAVPKTTKVPSRSSNRTYNAPYLEEFNTEESFEDFTVIDANNDGSTWSYTEQTNGGLVEYKYNSTNSADDWLITPGINLKGGTSYTVAFKARANSTNYHERIEAKWGQGNTVSDLTEDLIPSTELVNPDWVVLSKNITPTADGTYNFGLHAISDPDRFYLFLDSISVTELADDNAPDSVTALKATADPSGALKVTLSFNAPTKSINGNDLDDIDSIIVSKGNDTISTIKSVAPGSSQTVIDENAAIGTNKYDIVAVNGNGKGRNATISVIAGPDIPAAPDVKASDNLTSIKFTWPDVKGANNGLIIPSEVSYNILNTNIENNGDITLGDTIASVKGVNEYSINENTTNGEQDFKYWAFNAQNISGSSSYSLASVVEGAPYTLPYSNSFANGTLENQFFGVYASDDYPSWSLTSEKTADNDGGSAVFYNTMSGQGYSYSFAGEASLITGKISLTGAQNPELVFSYNSSISNNARLAVEIEHSNGDIETVWTKNFNSFSDTWNTAVVSLPVSVASEPYIFVHFHGFANTESEQEIYIDNIHVVAPYQNDAAISITTPSSLNKGQDANIIATLSNQGTDNLSSLEVKISVNDNVITDTIITKSLALFDKVDIPVTYKTSSTQNITSLNIKAEVVNAGDLNDENNTATANITLNQSDVNAPTSLQGTEAADSVHLSWAAPTSQTENITDDFESYNGWATSGVGDWTFVNADGGLFGSMSQNFTLPNTGDNAAYEVWRPNDYYQTGSPADAHSGLQALASIYKLSQTRSSFIDSDDWLISPELSGNAQTISFWVNNGQGNGYGTETFQVLASSTDKQTTSFTQIGNDYTQANYTWTQISVDLPEGTKYFAIRRTTNADDALIFIVDDITYETGTTASSYNIYIDGEYAGSTTETSFSFESDGANHTYSVTAVYSDGSESEPATIDIIANSIDDIHAQLNADKYDVYTIGGAQVKIGAKSLNGLTPGVYVINGKKVILK